MNNLTKKIVAIATGLTFAAMLFPVVPVQATTAEELQDQIDALMETLADLQDQLAELTGEPADVECSCTFTRSLYPGVSRGDDVKCLQEYLNDSGHTLAESGAGSPGSETTYFGSLTRAAVKAWQDANDVEYGDWWGYFGPISQAKYDEVCAVGEEEEEEEEEEGEGLTVVLADDTPEAAIHPLSASGVEFIRLTVTAGADEDLIVKGLTVERYGAGHYTDFSKLYVMVDGVRRGISRTLGSDDEVTLRFTTGDDPVTIPAGTSKDISVYADMANITAGHVNYLKVTGIVANADLEGLPIDGNSMVIASVAAPTITVTPHLSDQTVAVSDEQVELAKLKLKNGQSNEAVKVQSITLKSLPESGTVATLNEALSNVKMYVDGEVVSVGVITGKYVRFDMDEEVEILAGTSKYKYFVVKADIVGEPGETVQFIVENAGDISAYGTRNGYTITPTISACDQNSDSVSLVTISGVDLAITLDSSTPESATIVKDTSDIELVRARLMASQGSVIITGYKVTLTDENGSWSTNFDDETMWKNLRVYIDDELISEASGAEILSGGTSFTDEYEFDGTATLKVTIDAVEPSNTDTIKVLVNTLTGKRSSDEATISPTGTAQGYTMTLKTPTLVVYRSSVPVSVSRVQGSQDVEFLGLEFKAGTAVNVTLDKVKLELIACDGGTWSDIGATDFDPDSNDVQSIELIDVQGNVKATAKNLNSSEQVEFTNLGLNVDSNGTKLIVRGDITSDIADSDFVAGTDKLAFKVVSVEGTAGAETIDGVDSAGDTIDGTTNDAINDGTRIAVTIESAGTLTITLDNDTPLSAQLVAASEDSNIAKYKLVAAKEDVKLEKVKFALTTGVAGTDEISRIALYRGTDLLAEAYTMTGGEVEFDLRSLSSDLTTVKVGSSYAAYLIVKVDLNTTSENVLDSGSDVTISLVNVTSKGAINYVYPNSSEFIDSTKTTSAAMSDTTGTTVTSTSHGTFAAHDLIKIGSEQMLVTAQDTNTLTIIRGVNGSTAATHVTASKIYFVDNSGLTNKMKAVAQIEGTESSGVYVSPFSAHATLGADLNSSATSANLASTTGAGDVIKVGNEEMLVLDGTTNTATIVVRGINGTLAAAHSSGATVTFADRSGNEVSDIYYSCNVFPANINKVYGNKLAISDAATKPSGTIGLWSSYTSVFKFKLTPDSGATEDAVLNSAKVSFAVSTGIGASSTQDWNVYAIALYNGSGTKISEFATTADATGAAGALDASTDFVLFDTATVAAINDGTDNYALAEPISSSGEEFTVKVKVSGVVSQYDELALVLSGFGTLTSAGSINWDDSKSTQITWIDTTRDLLKGGSFIK